MLSTCTAGIPSGYIQDFSYGYNSGSANNGNVVSWTAMGSQAFNKSYTYDTLNRLSTMTGSGGNCTGLSWSFDAWGNRTAQTPTAGTCNQSNLTYDAHNRITTTGFSYDAAGNLVADGTHTYSYDEENRLTTVDGGATATYVYDPMGNRVQRTVGSSTANYLYDLDGNITTDLLPSGSDAADYIFAGGQLVAEYASGTTYFVHTNHLGTPSVVTNLSGSAIDCNALYPYGEQDNTICTTSYSIWDKFTGYRLDPETGLEYAHARYYNPSLGRFMSADPLGGDSRNPQSMNRYSYVLNNPGKLVDRSGMNPAVGVGGCTEFDPACSVTGASADLTFLGGEGGGGGAWFGNDIFDALSGAPGTYLTLDMFGNLNWAFSYALYSATYNVIDSLQQNLSSSSGNFDSAPPQSFFRVLVTNNGTETQEFGFVPELNDSQSGSSNAKIAFNRSAARCNGITDAAEFEDCTQAALDLWLPYFGNYATQECNLFQHLFEVLGEPKSGFPVCSK